MKLVVKQKKQNLDEAALKVSSSATEDIYKKIAEFIKKARAGDQSQTKFLTEIPFSELFYDKSKDVLSGIPVFYHAHVLGRDASEMAAFKYEWDRGPKQWNQDFINEFMDKSYPLNWEINGAMEGSGAVFPIKLEGKNVYVMSINIWNIDLGQFGPTFSEELWKTIRHEMQHLTQALNGLAITYGKQLRELQGNVEGLKTVEFSKRLKFGIGKKKYRTGFIQTGKAITQDSTPEELDRYFGDDDEFETWTSDIADSYFRYLFRAKEITKPVLENNRTDDIAKAFTDLLINDETFRQDFFVGSSYPKTFKSAIDSMMRVRSKEFPKKFRKKLAEIISTIKQMYKIPEEEKGDGKSS